MKRGQKRKDQKKKRKAALELRQKQCFAKEERAKATKKKLKKRTPEPGSAMYPLRRRPGREWKEETKRKEPEERIMRRERRGNSD